MKRKIFDIVIDKTAWGFAVGFILDELYDRRYWLSFSISFLCLHIGINLFSTAKPLFANKRR